MYISDADEFKEQNKVKANKSVERGAMKGLNKDLRVNLELGLIRT
ncbi:MAG: hypothetical protein Q8S01_02065 [Ignavibacteria bacterium]|nr:hypothetical protein [Ignavibacteria bacterium]